MTRYRITVPGDDELYHSRGPWKNHKYLQKIGKRYIYGKQSTQSGGGGNDSDNPYDNLKRNIRKAKSRINKTWHDYTDVQERMYMDGKLIGTRGRKGKIQRAAEKAERDWNNSKAGKAAKSMARDIRSAGNSAVRSLRKAASKTDPRVLKEARRQQAEAEARAAKAEERLSRKQKVKANQDLRKRVARQKAIDAAIAKAKQRHATEKNRKDKNKPNLFPSMMGNMYGGRMTRRDMSETLPDGYRITEQKIHQGFSSGSKKKTGSTSSSKKNTGNGKTSFAKKQENRSKAQARKRRHAASKTRLG